MLLFRSGLFLALLQIGVAMPASAQDIGSIVGNIIQGAVRADLYRHERQKRHAPQPVRPISQPLAPVALPAETPDAYRPMPPGAFHYTIQGHGLGETLDPKGMPKDFACTPSDQFAGSTWCRSRSSVRRIPVATAILISSAGKLVYGSDVYATANFAPGDIAGEIDRLSRNHRQRARILRMPPTGDDDGVIALWGAVTLDPIDEASRASLLSGSKVNAGILVDFLNNIRESAQRGLPVFRLGGGAGYFWAAKVGRDGHGSLRFGTSDVASLDGPPIPGVAERSGPTAEPSIAVGTNAAVEARQAELDHVTAVAKRVLDSGSGFVKSDPSDPGVLDLMQEISDLSMAIGNHDPDAISRKTAALTAALRGNARFAAYQVQRDEAEKRRAAQALDDALHAARQDQAFLTATVIADPTSPDAATFLPLIKRLDASIAAPDLERLQALHSAVDMAIRQTGFEDRYGRFVEKSPAVTDAGVVAKTGGAAENKTPGEVHAQQSRDEPGRPNPPKSEPDGVKIQRETALRAASLDNARAATAKIDDEIKQYVAQPSDSAVLALEFPEFSDWLEGEKSDGWTLKDQTFEVADYGAADWNGRHLPAPMTKATFQLSNPASGSVKDACFVFGRIDDIEANATHAAIAVACSEAAALNSWRTAHAFASRWTIE